MALASGCSDDPATPTLPPEDGGALCASNADCDDGVFCNGQERCAPGAPGADRSGCLPGIRPCRGACDEEGAFCPSGCVDDDADRDGVIGAACGGTDCDDRDPGRFPGNTEVCDPAGRDEDCDPSTLGFDLDGDGFIDARCCNGSACGDDCDDLDRSVFPDAADTCNGGDDDCDGVVDEEASLTFYRDADGDGFGQSGEGAEPPVMACDQPEGFTLTPGDCDDTSPFAFPGGTERCAPAGVDEDCDGNVDEFGEGAESPAVDLVTYFRDDDRDGFGATDRQVVGCAPPPGSWSRFPGDCRDNLPDVFPGRTDFVREPVCPTEVFRGDFVETVGPEFCDTIGEWVCRTLSDPSQPCTLTRLSGPSFEPWWDVDCSGDVRTPNSIACSYDEETMSCAEFGFGGMIVEDTNRTCGRGLGTFIGGTCRLEAPDTCVNTGDGPGPQACR